MKQQIVVFTGFNRAVLKGVGSTNGVYNALTRQWNVDRFKIWNRYTLLSIKNQCYTKWLYCVCCDVRTKHIMQPLFSGINDKRVIIVYTDQEEKVMKKISQRCDQIVMVRIDSDDIYHPFVLKELSDALWKFSEQNWFIWNHGYGYQYTHLEHDNVFGEMKTYQSLSSPFFAHRYINVSKWLEKGIIRETSHVRVKNKKPHVMDGNRVIVGLTGKNTSTNMKKRCFKQRVSYGMKTNILAEFKVI